MNNHQNTSVSTWVLTGLVSLIGFLGGMQLNDIKIEVRELRKDLMTTREKTILLEGKIQTH